MPEPHLVECVPNFSEGRRAEVVQAIVEAIERHAPVLDVHGDPDHNRSVVTLAGAPEDVFRAAVAGVEVAARLIRIEEHAGEHPRLGVADVVPFVPLWGVSMDEAVALARRVGRFIGTRLGMPVYYYGRAATRPDRLRLADIRRGGWEELKERLGKDPRWHPDAGHPFITPAGACVVGARDVLIAFNVALDSEDLEAARRVAAAVRQSGGGLPGVQALAFRLAREGRVQVSMNLLDYRRTGLRAAYRAVALQGVPVAYGEIVGLAPEESVAGLKPEEIRLRDGGFPVLEGRLREAGLL